MRIRLSIPDELNDDERKHALNAALESVTQTDAALIRSGKVPPAAAMIKAGKIRWKPEPPGDEHFDLASTVVGRGWGDCDDLAPYHAGGLRASGIDPGARAIVKRSGPRRWHALVQRSNGQIDDPSVAAGMGHSVSGLGDPPAFQRPMTAEKKLCLAICPSRDPRHPLVWYTRIDAPDHAAPFAWSSLAAHQTPQKSLLHAIKTMRRVAGDDLETDDDLRLAVVQDLVSGADPFDVAQALEEIVGDEDEAAALLLDGCQGLQFLDQVGSFGSFFKGLGKGLLKIVKPLASVVLPAAGTMFGGPLGTAAGAGIASLIPGGKPSMGKEAAMRKIAEIKAQLDQHRAQKAAALAAGAPPPPPVQVPAATAAALTQTFQGAPQGFPQAQGFPQGFPGGGFPWFGFPGFAPPQFAPQFSPHFAQQFANAQPTYMTEPGTVVRPFGAEGPAVMRF